MARKRNRAKAQKLAEAKDSITENREQNRSYAMDAFANALARLGTGTPNLLESTEYPNTRLTQDFNLMNSLYRSHWIVRKIIGGRRDTCKNRPHLL